MANHSTLRGYAEKFESDRSSLPQNLVLTHTETSLTVFDKYRKAEYHLLVLPRIRADSEFSGDDLKDLQTLLAKGKKAKAKTLIEELKKDAKAVKRIVEGRMFKAKGKNHLHLHVISSDFRFLDKGKQYNKYHPKLGFFLHINEVLSWFKDDTSFERKVEWLKQEGHEALLDRDLECWRCQKEFKDIEGLKEHFELGENFAAKKGKACQVKKGEGPEGDTDEVNLKGGEPKTRVVTVNEEPVSGAGSSRRRGN